MKSKMGESQVSKIKSTASNLAPIAEEKAGRDDVESLQLGETSK